SRNIRDSDVIIKVIRIGNIMVAHEEVEGVGVRKFLVDGLDKDVPDSKASGLRKDEVAHSYPLLGKTPFYLGVNRQNAPGSWVVGSSASSTTKFSLTMRSANLTA